VISLGFDPDRRRIRRKVSGKTKAIVQDRLKALHTDVETGVRAQPNYTVRRAAEDWLAHGLHGRSPKTIKKNENVLTPILATIGGRRLRELTADDVRQALAAMALRYSSAAVAMGLDQGSAPLAAAERTRMHAYIAYAWRPASAQKRPGRCAGSTWTAAIPWATRPCRPALPCGDRYALTGIPRPRNRAGPFLSYLSKAV